MKEMKKGQEEMKKELEMGQEETKNLIRAEKEEMRAYIESQVEEMKENVNRSIGKVEEDVQEAEVLQGIPSDKLTDLMFIKNALEARFGDSHLTQFYRTELKMRRQKPGESHQVFSRRCGATNEPGLRRVPSGCPRQPSSPVLH
ncbi:hypothetical protein AVEN_265489-1 [Araneus ventricosus]|uniref:Uncharacterized protein n=1 Tax=Araneus ventricosus TaxID=182803 RepID=A0A4Y2CJJ8_ARAVE|nr:hypothetical protein AVEN_265489-1 [Araneus ventricosus]